MTLLHTKHEKLESVLCQAIEADRVAELTVGDVMTRNPSCIGDETTALDLARTFQAGKFRHLLVVDSRERLCGVVSDRDVIGLISPVNPPSSDYLAGIPTTRLMSTDMLKASPLMTLTEATRLMIANGIHCLPVVEHEQSVGILTSTDLELLLLLLLDQGAANRSSQATHSTVSA